MNPNLQDRELVISRVVDASRDRLFAGWTQSELLKRWFAPRPLTTTVCELDLRVGGRMVTVMRTPDGQEYPSEGVFLEIVPNERLVFTDAFTGGWNPKPEPFMVAILTFEDAGDGQCLYTARARHWSVEKKEEHARMGFERGWNQCLDQLVELVGNAKPA